MISWASDGREIPAIKFQVADAAIERAHPIMPLVLCRGIGENAKLAKQPCHALPAIFGDRFKSHPSLEEANVRIGRRVRRAARDRFAGGNDLIAAPDCEFGSPWGFEIGSDVDNAGSIGSGQCDERSLTAVGEAERWTIDCQARLAVWCDRERRQCRRKANPARQQKAKYHVGDKTFPWPGRMRM